MKNWKFFLLAIMFAFSTSLNAQNEGAAMEEPTDSIFDAVNLKGSAISLNVSCTAFPTTNGFQPDVDIDMSYYPANYQYSTLNYNDSLKASYTFDTITINNQYYKKVGFYKILANGQGSITMNGVTYSNALKVEYKEIYFLQSFNTQSKNFYYTIDGVLYLDKTQSNKCIFNYIRARIQHGIFVEDTYFGDLCTIPNNGTAKLNPTYLESSYITAVDKVTYFPNPLTSDVLQANFYLIKDATISIKIITATGNQIDIIQNEKLPEGKILKNIDLSKINLANGIYVIETKINNRLLTQKLSVLK